MLKQKIEDLDNDGFGLADALYDQCNLDYNYKNVLEAMEEWMFELLKQGKLTDEKAVNLVKQFCRNHSGPGFYDCNGRMKYIVTIWKYSMVEYLDEINHSEDSESNNVIDLEIQSLLHTTKCDD